LSHPGKTVKDRAFPTVGIAHERNMYDSFVQSIKWR
jgi:hypothetical protein